LTTVPGTDRLLTASEVAELVGVSTRWIEDAARRDSIPHVRLGRFVRFRRESVLEWIARQERGS
jgi:excisionase family DNA binding protein